MARDIANLIALGFPEALKPELLAAVQLEDDAFVKAGCGRGVVLRHRTMVRVAPLQWLEPLRFAAQRLDDASVDELSSILPIAAGSSGSTDDALALLDPVACSMRHSAKPTHVFACLVPEGSGGPVSVAWPTDTTMLVGVSGDGDLATVAPLEATRDRLQGRFMLDAPLYRAVQSVPWLDLPDAWFAEDDRAACQRLVSHDGGARTRLQRAGFAACTGTGTGTGDGSSNSGSSDSAHCRDCCQVDGSSAGSTDSQRLGCGGALGLSTSASGRQVFLAWLAQGSSAAMVGTQPLIGGTNEHEQGREQPWRVYSDLAQVKSSLTRPEFVLVASCQEADIVWTGEHIRSFADYASTTRPLLNQFPHESVLIAKNLLAECAQATYGGRLPWLAETFTLPHELPAFVHRCLSMRQEENDLGGGHAAIHGTDEPALPRTKPLSEQAAPALAPAPATVSTARRWIIKPWNMSRSRGIVIAKQRARLQAREGHHRAV